MDKNTRRNIIGGVAIALALGIAATLAITEQGALAPNDEVELTDSTEVEQLTYEYGIPVDDYDIRYGIVEDNQTLSTLLRSHGLAPGDVHRLTERAVGTFDVRKIRSGQAYAVFYSRDSVPEVKYFVYEESPRSYVVFDLAGQYSVRRGENPVEWQRKTAKGSVETSLWVAMQEAGSSPLLAVTLSNIFGWTIDFFGLQKEDGFKVIYEQEYVDGHGLDSFRVVAASFTHGDSTYYAIPFTQDGEELYYNERGNSLEGAFLKAPLDFYRISSSVTMTDIGCGFLKALVFGILVTAVCCHQGYFANTRKDSVGPEAVGNATTSAVVIACVLILATDYVLTSLFL